MKCPYVPKVHGIYRHFKGNTYEILSVVRSAEKDGEFIVVYKRIIDNSVWARSLQNFFEKIPPNRADNVTGNTYRFEPVNSRKEHNWYNDK